MHTHTVHMPIYTCPLTVCTGVWWPIALSNTHFGVRDLDQYIQCRGGSLEVLAVSSISHHSQVWQCTVSLFGRDLLTPHCKGGVVVDSRP